MPLGEKTSSPQGVKSGNFLSTSSVNSQIGGSPSWMLENCKWFFPCIFTSISTDVLVCSAAEENTRHLHEVLTTETTTCMPNCPNVCLVHRRLCIWNMWLVETAWKWKKRRWQHGDSGSSQWMLENCDPFLGWWDIAIGLSVILALLTELTKKDQFKWSPEAEAALPHQFCGCLISI